METGEQGAKETNGEGDKESISEAFPTHLTTSSLRYLPGTNCLIRKQVSLATLTSLRVGGPAQWYVAPQDLAGLQASFEWAQAEGLAVTLLGAGSNLLVSDRGIPGLVVGTRHLRRTYFDLENGQVTVAAGEPLPRLAWQAAERGWQGLEWAVGIPGSVGGAVVMNAGAHNSSVADMLVNTQVLSPRSFAGGSFPQQSSASGLETLTPPQLGYSYRTSLLQKSERIVTQATFKLQPGADPQQVMATTSQHLKQRRASQPYHLPSCGSVFRNSIAHKAGWLIEQTGLKGYQIGGAQVAQRHANFILNCGGATASDIFSLICYIQDQVEKHWAICLEPEVRILGEFH